MRTSSTTPGSPAAVDTPHSDITNFFLLSKDLLCVIGLDGRLKNVNPSLAKFVGYSENQLVSEPYWVFLHEDDLPGSRRRMSEMAGHADKLFFESRCKRYDGQYVWIKWMAYKLTADGPVYLVGSEKPDNPSANRLYTKNEAALKILESITDGFYFLDKNWNVKYFNKQAEYIFNISREEILGKNMWDCYPEEKDKGFYKRFQEAMANQTSAHFEEYFARLNKWGEVTAYPSVDGLSVYFRDISERKRKEQEISEMNRNYKLIIKATSGAIWEYDLQNDYCYWHDDNFRELFGHDIVNKNVPHKFWESLIHPDDKAAKLKQVAALLEDRLEMASSEYRFKRADGSYAHVLERTYLVMDGNGVPLKIIGCTEDITAVKRAEEAVRESETNYRQLFEKGPLPQYICKSETMQILKVNEAALDLYGYSEQEFLQMNIRSFRSQEDQESLDKSVAEAKQSPGRCRFLVTHVRKNGEEMTVEVASVNIVYNNERCLLVTISDQTKRLQLEKEVTDVKLSAQKNITKATIDGQEKQREEIGKELHDNVNPVLATAKLYMSCVTASEPDNYHLVQKSIESIAYSIDEIRRLSRTLIPPSLGEISLEEAINDLAGRVQFVKGEIVNTEINGLAEEVLGEGLKISIYRIIQEQLNNIMKHSGASRIGIRITQNAYNLTLLIEDNGRGFDVQAKRNGIGITNIINRAEVYNGQVAIDSAPGSGCILFVTFRL